jgi:hypothetical protein
MDIIGTKLLQKNSSNTFNEVFQQSWRIGPLFISNDFYNKLFAIILTHHLTTKRSNEKFRGNF